jgi:hypothetical protein
MNAFEKIMLALLGTAEAEAPVFVKSTSGTLILNASEALLANLLTAFAPAPPVAPVSTPSVTAPAAPPAA